MPRGEMSVRRRCSERASNDSDPLHSVGSGFQAPVSARISVVMPHSRADTRFRETAQPNPFLLSHPPPPLLDRSATNNKHWLFCPRTSIGCTSWRNSSLAGPGYTLLIPCSSPSVLWSAEYIAVGSPHVVSFPVDWFSGTSVLSKLIRLPREFHSLSN